MTHNRELQDDPWKTDSCALNPVPLLHVETVMLLLVVLLPTARISYQTPGAVGTVAEPQADGTIFESIVAFWDVDPGKNIPVRDGMIGP